MIVTLGSEKNGYEKVTVLSMLEQLTIITMSLDKGQMTKEEALSKYDEIRSKGIPCVKGGFLRSSIGFSISQTNDMLDDFGNKIREHE